MSQNPGYQYQLVVKVVNSPKGKADSFRQKVGIRSLNWNHTGIYVNHKKVYLRGYGRHEDSDVRGKGLDLSIITKDFNLMRWTGGNAFRTSHYPYAEEIMDFADDYG